MLTPPLWQAGGLAMFPLGTDELGRCLLSRLLHGARISLLIGAASVLGALLPGVVLGLVAAFNTNWVSAAIMRVMDILLALPGLLLAIAIISILGPGLVNTGIAIAVGALPGYVRLTRAALSMLPHSGNGGCTPSPRKPSAAVSRIAELKPNVALMMSGPRQFGSTVSNIRRSVPAPATRLAVT